MIEQVNKDNLMVVWRLEGERRQLNMTQFLLGDGLVFCDFIIYQWKVKNTSEEYGECCDYMIDHHSYVHNSSGCENNA